MLRYRKSKLVLFFVIIALCYIDLEILDSSELFHGDFVEGLFRTNRFMEDMDPTKPCGLRGIRNFIRKHGSFPGSGHWNNSELGYPKAHYTTPDCVLHPPMQAATDTMKYLSLAKPRKIVIIGDSQGWQFTAALSKLLTKQTHYRFRKTLKQEAVNENGYLPSEQYYLKDTGLESSALIITHRTCHSCLGHYYRFTHNETHETFDLEYISMMLHNHSSIKPNASFCQNPTQKAEILCSVSNQQEFLFKFYLREQPPDLLLLFTTFAHDHNRKLKDVRKSLNYLHTLIQETIPRTSDIVWFPTTSVNLLKISETSRLIRYDNNLDAHDIIVAMNAILAESLQEWGRYDKEDNHYGFLDVHMMSQKVQSVWGTDLIHMKHHFYSSIIAYVMQILAQDAQENTQTLPKQLIT